MNPFDKPAAAGLPAAAGKLRTGWRGFSILIGGCPYYFMEMRLRRGRLAGDGGVSRIAYRVSRIAYLGEKRVLKEKGR